MITARPSGWILFFLYQLGFRDANNLNIGQTKTHLLPNLKPNRHGLIVLPFIAPPSKLPVHTFPNRKAAFPIRGHGQSGLRQIVSSFPPLMRLVATELGSLLTASSSFPGPRILRPKALQEQSP